jgi:hypothetical protein
MIEEITHLDILGRELKVGMPVAVATRSGGLKICTVKILTPKMVRVEPVKKEKRWNGKDMSHLIYASDTVIIGGEDVLMYVLKYGS